MNMSYDTQKAALTAMVLRLHPSTQPLKNRMAKNIIAQLFLETFSLKISDIQKHLKDKFNIYLTVSEVKDILRDPSLFELDKDDNYKLSDDFRDKLKGIEKEVERRYEKVISSLFSQTEDFGMYLDAFLNFIGIIFSKITEEYIKLLKGEIDSLDLAGEKYFNETLESTLKKYKSVDKEIFKKGVEKFFVYSDPDYDYIKWTTAQNYYLSKALGLDPSGHLLTENKFKNGIFYIDTNILIAHIFSAHIHNLSTEYLFNALKKLNGKIKIAYIGIKELQSWLNYRLEVLEKVHSEIPDNINLRDPIYLEFKKLTEKQESDASAIKEFREYVQKKISLIKNTFEIVDDPWFVKMVDDNNTKKLIKMLKERYRQTRQEEKSDSAAVHDALILQWIDKERKDISNSKIWLITLDTSLPSMLYQGESTLSITLDAFLQWCSPFVNDSSMEEIFSLLIKNRFFPQEKVFDLKDFLIFHELEIRAKDLPPEDIKDAIICLKKKFGRIDLDNLHSLPEISYELARFFVDPTRKYQQEIRKAYEKQEELKKYYEEKLGNLSKQIEEIKNTYEIELKEKDRKLKDKEQEIINIQDRLKRLENEREQEKLKDSAIKRLMSVILITLIIEVGIVCAINKYSIGENLFRKLTNSWSWLTLGIPTFILLGWLLIGKRRLIALGWPFNKIFKLEEK